MLHVLSSYFRALDVLIGPFFGHTFEKLIRNALPVPEKSIDERLAKIEVARAALLESLQAMEDLKVQAGENKRELAEALSRIEVLKEERLSAEREVDALRTVAKVDAGALKRLFEVPGQGRIWRERFYGLLSGILGSIIAALLWEWAT